VGSIHAGIPKIDGLFHGKSIYKWMKTRGSPVLGNLHIELVIMVSDGYHGLASGKPTLTVENHFFL
jgi:hypothetical protein